MQGLVLLFFSSSDSRSFLSATQFDMRTENKFNATSRISLKVSCFDLISNIPKDADEGASSFSTLDAAPALSIILDVHLHYNSQN